MIPDNRSYPKLRSGAKCGLFENKCQWTALWSLLSFMCVIQKEEGHTVLATAGLVDWGCGYCNPRHSCGSWAVILSLDMCHFLR